MRRLSKHIKKNKYVGFDVETYGKTNKFYSGGLYWIDRGKERFEYFTDKEKMAEFMLTRKFRTHYLVATNLNFDFTVVFYETKYWNDFKILMRQGNIIQASYDLKHKHGYVRFIDTSNYAFMSVAKLGEIIGSDKLEKPKWLGKKKPEDIDERLELMNYNRQDCKITHDFMNFFQEGVNSVGGNVKLTIASTSLNTWRMNYQPNDLIKEEYVLRDSDIKKFIFEGYYGGRTEVFKRGTFKKINYYDINSLYPFAMKKEFPLPQSVQKIHRDLVSIDNVKNFEGVTRARVTIKNIDKPLLPLRYNDKLMFPVGTFEGTWNHVELRKALKLGYKIQCKEQIIYRETFNPFSEFVDNFYELRNKFKNDNNAFEFIVKILMNSLYGKFGMKLVEKYKIIDKKELTDYDTMKKLIGNSAFTEKGDKIIIREQKAFNGIYSFPILASYVTSYSRLIMYDYLIDDKVVYTDTDSIMTESELTNTGNELGQMKIEGKYPYAIFVKPKFYLVWFKARIKGVASPTVEDFDSILRGEKVVKQKFTRLKESVRRGMKPNTIIDVPKNLTLMDEKREWEHTDLNRIANSKPIEVSL